MRPLLFVDRDGVINRESEDFVKSAAEWHPLPGSLAALAELDRAGFALVVVSNQSGLGRGLLTRGDLEAIHLKLRGELQARGARLAGLFYCPHRPGAGCVCRKPAPTLLHAAARVLGGALAGAPLIGDRPTDLEAARGAGCRPYFVRSGLYADLCADDPALRGAQVCRDLAEAAHVILAGGVGSG